jgi:hypothetical protein
LRDTLGINITNPDISFAKYTNLVVKLITAKVNGGKATFYLFFNEQNYHLRNYLERLTEIEGLGEYFATPCKWVLRKVSFVRKFFVCIS